MALARLPTDILPFFFSKFTIANLLLFARALSIFSISLSFMLILIVVNTNCEYQFLKILVILHNIISITHCNPYYISFLLLFSYCSELENKKKERKMTLMYFVFERIRIMTKILPDLLWKTASALTLLASKRVLLSATAWLWWIEIGLFAPSFLTAQSPFQGTLWKFFFVFMRVLYPIFILRIVLFNQPFSAYGFVITT